MRPSYIWLSLFYVLSTVRGQEPPVTTSKGLNTSSYIGLLETTTSSEAFSLFDGSEAKDEIEKVSRALLEPRQGRTCSAGPGGPVCSATTCCAAGRRCCPGGCCLTTENCMGAGRCCPQIAQTCGGSTCCQPGSICCPASSTGCCIAGSTCCSSSRTPCCPPGFTCCGNTCCSGSETCERNTCVNTSLLTSKRVVRFELNEKKNGHLLRNMCNGMRGENTIELTYSGQMSDSAKRRKRTDAGCVAGYCARLAQPGLNSCDEFPPASSDEGGNTLPRLLRAINCIPGKQNSRQGQRFSAMVRSSGIKKGQTFVISIDCDEVLGSIVPRDVNPFEHGGDDGYEQGEELGKRDVVDLSGTSDSENIFPPESALNETTHTLIVDFGDLGAGSYQVEFTVVTGSIEAGGFILDNMGDQLASVTSTSTLQPGDTERLSFNIEADGELMGVGLILPTRNSATTISWKFVGEDLRPSSSRGTQSPASTDGASDAGGALGSAVNAMPQRLTILLPLLRLLYSL